MARIRTIKPEFTTSAQVVECSRDARLLFILMWMFCDDYGVHPANVKQLKMECFPGDDLSTTEVQTLVDELIANSLLVYYAVDGEGYWKVTGWKHQRIDKRQPAKYPLADGKIPAEDDADSKTIPGAFQERSKNGRGTLQERSTNIPRPFPPERKGKERKGKDKKGEEKNDNHSLIGSGDEIVTPATSRKKSPGKGGGEGPPTREAPEPRVRKPLPEYPDENEFERRKREQIEALKREAAGA